MRRQNVVVVQRFLYKKYMVIYMLSQTLLDSEDDIDYLKYWEKTIMYKFFRKKQPSERWCRQLRRILDSDNKNK